MNNTGMKFGGRQKGTPNKRTAITENGLIIGNIGLGLSF